MKKNNTLTRENLQDLEQLAENLHSLEGTREVLSLLQELHTESELHNLSLRWRLMKMLDQGVSQRNIAESLGISLCKITRGSKILKDKTSICSSIVPRAAAMESLK
ncbi:Trp family transcriptional regulator [Spirochaeta lutea]|uniref:Trp family transcriptional regulator n=1 Tax=Spirochaeta lutea TaxID=1480694 RepID=UPI0009DD633A|nr:Trp family transcriptional regulator [Spirochaeta lutea]